MGLKSTPEHFWSRVDVRSLDECWNWLGSCNNCGYGTLVYQQEAGVAHRVAGFLLGIFPQIASPKDRKGSGFGLHSCDNPKCCNPTHIESGTYSKNQTDAYSRGRRSMPRGHKHVNSRLTKKQVLKIRSRYAKGGISQDLLALEYGVSQVAISHIIRRRTYTDF